MGALRVGYEYYGKGQLLNAIGNVVRDHHSRDEVKLYPYQSGTKLLAGSVVLPLATPLSASQVGPAAWPGA